MYLETSLKQLLVIQQAQDKEMETPTAKQEPYYLKAGYLC